MPSAPMDARELVSTLPAIVDLHQHQYEALLRGELDLTVLARAQIKSALDEIVARLELIQHQRQGDRDELWALCPFHDDHHVGSFSIDSSSGNFYCWVCGAGGGLIALLRSFGLWTHSMRASLKDLDLRALARQNQRTQTCQELAALPEGVLSSIRHWRPRRYLSRGHSRHILDTMEVCYDPHRQRICFPVRSAKLDLVGVQSRVAFDDQQDIRWKWYRFEFLDLAPELFESEDIDDYAPPRSTCLYNEHQVLLPLALGDIEELVLVEGMGGAMRVMAAGHSVVATFGTRIAASQRYRLIDALRRAQERRGEPVRVICAQDGDLPGRAAALELLLSLGTYAQCTLAIIPTGKDPEDLSVGDLRTCLLESVTLSEAMEDSELRSDLMSAFVSVAETMQRRAR